MLRQSAKENFFTVEINIPHHGWGMLDTYTLLKQLFFDLNDINTQEAAKLFRSQSFHHTLKKDSSNDRGISIKGKF